MSPGLMLNILCSVQTLRSRALISCRRKAVPLRDNALGRVAVGDEFPFGADAGWCEQEEAARCGGLGVQEESWHRARPSQWEDRACW